jgi:hypothetical protein
VDAHADFSRAKLFMGEGDSSGRRKLVDSRKQADSGSFADCCDWGAFAFLTEQRLGGERDWPIGQVLPLPEAGGALRDGTSAMVYLSPSIDVGGLVIVRREIPAACRLLRRSNAALCRVPQWTKLPHRAAVPHALLSHPFWGANLFFKDRKRKRPARLSLRGTGDHGEV